MVLDLIGPTDGLRRWLLVTPLTLEVCSGVLKPFFRPFSLPLVSISIRTSFPQTISLVKKEQPPQLALLWPTKPSLFPFSLSDFEYFP